MFCPLDLDVAFLALADSTRRAILARLTMGEATVMEIAEPFAMSQPAISKHLNVLERAGLISRRKVGRTRCCRAEREAVAEVSGWLDRYRQALTANFARLDRVLESMKDEDES